MFADTKQFFKKTIEQVVSVIGRVRDFAEDSKRKFHNLYQTNYDTGMYHLEHGNLWDATFRFKIIKRFWPNELEAQYKYAYCLVLQGLNSDAGVFLNEILAKDANYSEAKELLEKINNNDTAEIIADFKAKLNQNDDTEVKNDDLDK